MAKSRVPWGIGFLLLGCLLAAFETESFSEESNLLPRRFVLALDGIPYSLVIKRQKEGGFKDFFPVSRMISTFPSLSDCAFSDIYGTSAPLGYQRYHYDANLNRMIGGIASDLGSPIEYEAKMHVAFTGTLHHMKAYMSPVKTFRKELKSVIENFWKSKSEIFYAYLLGPDAILHMGGNMEQELAFLDGELGQLQSRYKKQTGRKLEIVLLSDHGNTLVKRGKRVRIKKHLKQAGFHATKKIKKENDVALVISGPLNFIALSTQKSQIDRLAQTLLSLEGVALVTHIDKDKPSLIHVRNPLGEYALILKKRGKTAYTYRPIQGDPLGYLPLLNQLRQKGKLSNDGFASADDWFEISTTVRYPAALERIFRGHHEVAQNRSPILVSLEEGYENVNQFIKGFYSLKFAGTHGGLDSKASNGILMTNFRKTPDLTSNRVPSFFQWRGFSDD